MIISYEMFLRTYDSLKSVRFDVIVCDEGHRLKNNSTKTTSVYCCTINSDIHVHVHLYRCTCKCTYSAYLDAIDNYTYMYMHMYIQRRMRTINLW